MSKSSETVPLLRFPEFGDLWQRTPLDEVATFASSKRVYLSDYVEEGVPFYRGKEISELKRNQTPEGMLYISEESYAQYKEQYGVPEIGDILITAVGTLGNVLRITQSNPFYFKDGNLIWLRDPSQDPGFLELLLECKNDDVLKSSIGSSQRALTMVELKKLKFCFPTLLEQRKIADFLTAVDGRIGKLIQKKALFTDYKKGVMQQLFTQAIRFKDDHGNDFPDWEEKKLGEVCELVNGLTYSPEDVAKKGLLVLRSSNVQDGQIVFDENVFVTSEVKGWNLSRPNDILICVRNGSKRLIGKNAMIPEGCPPSTHGAFMTVLRGDQNQFLFQLLQTDVYKRNVYINLGATINSINGGDLKKFKFMFPSLDEQTKIADFLSAIDRKIKSVASQITETQTFKRGLLQQMFV